MMPLSGGGPRRRSDTSMKRFSLSMIFNQRNTMARFLILIICLFISPVANVLSGHFAYAEPADIPSLILSLRMEGIPSMVWFEKGKALYKLMAYREAAETFSRIEKDGEKDGMPQDIIEESLYLRANSLMKIGGYSEAVASLNLIPDKSRFYSYGLFTKAMINLRQGNEKDAIEIFEQISKSFPAENLAFKAHLTSGFIFLERGNPSEAVGHFAVIPVTSPSYVQALFGSGWAYARMGRWVRAVVFWEELSSRYPESKYAREVMPYIGHAYTTLSAYGKALEQNGAALRYYENLLKRVSDIGKEIPSKNMKTITQAVGIVGDKGLSDDLELYQGLLSVEGYLLGQKDLGESPVGTLITASKKMRDDIADRLSERLSRRIEDLRHQLLEASFNASLEIARNLRLEGGGRISNDMIFNEP